MIRQLTFSFLVLFLASCNSNNQTPPKASPEAIKLVEEAALLERLQTPLGEPRPGEWLSFKDEKGQNFKEYVEYKPVRPSEYKNKIYIQPIGSFNEREDQLMDKLTEYIGLFFQLEVVVLDDMPDSVVPKNSRRYNFGIEQLHSKYILDKVLIPNIPGDAVALSAITNMDLYPRDSWNFVFGQANLKKRVGVSSFHRMHVVNLESEKDFNQCLRRIMRTATHEIAHMLSMKHCTTHKCMLNGSNSLDEADQKPLHLCHDCHQKLSWNLKYDSVERFIVLKEFFEQNGFEKEAKYYSQAIALLNSRKKAE